MKIKESNNIGTESYSIEIATSDHLDEIESLYNSLHDYLQAGINYPGWIKGIYPTRETAAGAIKNNTIFILFLKNEIAGSVILNHEPETAYKNATWGIDSEYEKVTVIHTLAVHPKFIKKGVGKSLMDFAKTYSIKQNMQTIRLDVSAHNTPAIALYEKCGYHFVETVDLGLNVPNLVWFHLYEMIL